YLWSTFMFCSVCYIICFDARSTTVLSTLSLHDALPICRATSPPGPARAAGGSPRPPRRRRSSLPLAPLELVQALARQHQHRLERSEEHTSELQSRENLVCRLLLEKKKNNKYENTVNIQK